MEIVNGFQCKNCADVDYAKKHIDPAHPKDGPFGVNKTSPSGGANPSHGPAVLLSGALAVAPTDGVDKTVAAPGAATPPKPPTRYASGANLNLSV